MDIKKNKPINFFIGEIKIPVKKCKKPSFKSHRGRTWDSGKININDEEYEAFLDTSWGKNIYFQFGENKQWYTVNMWSDPSNQYNGKGVFDIDPFSNTPCKIQANQK